MNFVRFLLSILMVTTLTGCKNGLLGAGSGSDDMNLMGEDGTGNDERPISNLIRSQFNRVENVNVSYAFDVLPMGVSAQYFPCIQEGDCPPPPEYRPRAVVRISGSGYAYWDGIDFIQADGRPHYLQSLTVEYPLAVDEEKRCLVAAASAIQDSLGLAIAGTGNILQYAYANSDTGTVDSSGGSAESGSGTVSSPSTTSDQPISIWPGYQSVIYDRLVLCQLVKDANPLPVEPIDPVDPTDPREPSITDDK